jgi:hypothetical protein
MECVLRPPKHKKDPAKIIADGEQLFKAIVMPQPNIPFM